LDNTKRGAELVNSNVNGRDDIKKNSISEEEKKHRKEAWSFARANIGLEGYVPSEGDEARAQRFINGDISLEEYVEVDSSDLKGKQ
jgi:hypothetical protein